MYIIRAMKISIKKHIFELLKYHDCVIITGLGGFILNEKSGYLNQITNQIHPPSKIISFNTKVVQNDGLLANYLASKENISYDQACLEILKFSRQTKLKIQKGQSIIFENIGELNLNNNNKIEFTPFNLFNFNASSYGLKNVQPSKLKPQNYSKQNALIAACIILLLFVSFFSLKNNSMEDMLVFSLNPISTNHYSPRKPIISENDIDKETPGIYNVKVSQVDFDLYKINGTNYHISTKKCFKLGFGRDVQIKIWRDEKNRTQRQVCFLNISETEYDDCYKITEVYNELSSENNNKVMVLTKRGKMKEAMLVLEETYIDPYIIANSSPDETINETIDQKEDTLQIKDIGSRFIEAIQSLNEPVENTHNNSTHTPDTKETVVKNIYIIAGSFSSLQNAEALTKQLKKRGFFNTRIIGKNDTGLIRVSIDNFYTEDEAHLALEEVKKKLSSAWVLNLNK